MTRTLQALLTLSDARIQRESRIAAAIATADSRYRRRKIRIVLSCIVQYGIGLSILGSSLHVYGSDLGAVAFYGGMLIALCGPVWTVLLALWLEQQR